jgi:hypothetical protein
MNLARTVFAAILVLGVTLAFPVMVWAGGSGFGDDDDHTSASFIGRCLCDSPGAGQNHCSRRWLSGQ